MTIRLYETQDRSDILGIYAASKLDELKFETAIFELLPLESDKKRLAELMESDIYVYDDGNSIIAYGAIYGCEVRALFVHPSERGHGVGKRLLKYLLFRINGSASLYVAKSNSPAIKLYKNFGFSVCGEFETSYNGIAVLANKMIRHINTRHSLKRDVPWRQND